MKLKFLLFILTFFTFQESFAQFRNTAQQYFDGADTNCLALSSNYSICINFDEDTANIWQVGQPQKTLFDSAATFPNALMTDTLNYYPPNNQSSFHFTVNALGGYGGVVAIRWKQKLDMEKGSDGGKIEFSGDRGQTWQNIFNNPYVYNLFGFKNENLDTLQNGEIVFSGTDSVWRDIWLCYDISWLSRRDSIIVKFTFNSDSVEKEKEGWMIDNMLGHVSIKHTINEVKKEKYINIYPNPSSDKIFIELEKINNFHIIEHMVLTNNLGEQIDEWKDIPTKFFIDGLKYPNGHYFLKIKTNLKSETLPIIINHK